MLHIVVISEIIINRINEIESKKLNPNGEIIDYLSSEEGVLVDGKPSFFYFKKFWVKCIEYRYYSIKS